MSRRAHNSKLPALINYDGKEFKSLAELYRQADPRATISLNTFRGRVSRYYQKYDKIPEEVIREAFYLNTQAYKTKYGIRKTWVDVDGVKFDAGEYYQKNEDQAAVNYKAFRSRVAGSYAPESIDMDRLEEALTMSSEDWRTFYGGGRNRSFVYKGGKYPDQKGKSFHSIAAFLKTIGRYEDKANIWNRLKLGWDLDQALTTPFSRPNDGTGLIYLITRLSSGQVYVGLSKASLDDRWIGHISKAKQGATNRFAKAIRSDGSEGFDLQVIEDGIEDDKLLSKREAYWVDIFDSRGTGGLNTAPAGGLGGVRGKKVEYGGESFTSLKKAGDILGERYGLKPWIVITRLAKGEQLPKKARVHSDHPDAGSNLYRRWLALLKRHPDEVSEEWKSNYDSFKESVTSTQTDGMKLIRRNPSKAWGKGNFKWVTTQEKVEQAHGKELVVHGKTYPSIEAVAKQYKIGASTIKYRMRQCGMSPEEAVSIPISPNLKKKKVEIDGKVFTSNNEAAKYLVQTQDLTLGQARYRVQRGDYDG